MPIVPSTPRVLVAGLVATLALATTTAPAIAGTVTGKVAIDATRFGSRPAPPNQGFLGRIENPLAPIKPFDPLPYMIVVLEGPGEGEPNQPKLVRYDIVGESFERPVTAVLLNTDIELHNSGRGAPVIAADGKPDLVPADPINPGGGHTIKASTAGLLVLRAQKAAHLVGRVLVLPHRFFATVNAKGEFSLDDVPAGRWTVRIWYKDGWLERTDETIDVGTKGKTNVEPKVTELKLAKAS
jgi:hypothetical protein